MNQVKEVAKHATSTIVITGICGIIIVAVMLIGTFGYGWFSSETANTRGETNQRENTVVNPNYRIAHYDMFFDRCQAIVAKECDIGDLKAAIPGDDKTQLFYDQQNLRADESSRRDLITQYNADAAKEGTAGQFRSSKLPATINVNGATKCTP